jgi:hypothetical protein
VIWCSRYLLHFPPPPQRPFPPPPPLRHWAWKRMLAVDFTGKTLLVKVNFFVVFMSSFLSRTDF